ncbi:Co2+/Mg2+ efflux protein ApaG [Aliidiomarina quisquiliarum]|uniref:Co2+/Mg2+ efflux protein ApaG n=1 Tax=Aliidiomarina quisquiliarum TaxID=2938947 RepID=UPI00208E01A5|nr:Co2+/Mg2+ efflux protein ApaG [Aliidiomarina quisquiliarum]MCO4322627.1 Co2+/Mg2+ efflux protein ApaG [Aliidiomarina quisquiliarum]
MLEPTIALRVKTQYLPLQSKIAQNQFVFAYTITLTNQSTEQVQLLTRQWTITNADGEVTEVEGDGVVGQQPLIAPGDSFSYTSGTVLSTPVGIMQGSYGMINKAGMPFNVAIPQFRLALPNILH